MTMLKRLKSLFIVEEEASEPIVRTKDGKRVITSLDANMGKPVVSSGKKNNFIKEEVIPKEKTSSALNTKMVEKLLIAVNRKDLEGFDYLEFKEAIKALDSMGMDEETKFKSAFATAKTLGLTKLRLTNSVKYYIDVLHDEGDNFDENLKNKKYQDVGKRKDEAVDIQKKIDKINAQIEKLKKEITKKEKYRIQLLDSTVESENKYIVVEQEFNEANTYLREQFEEDLKKIKKYL